MMTRGSGEDSEERNRLGELFIAIANDYSHSGVCSEIFAVHRYILIDSYCQQFQLYEFLQIFRYTQHRFTFITYSS